MKNKYSEIQNTKDNICDISIDWRTIAFSHPERTIRLGTSFSGLGAIEHAFHRLGLTCQIMFAGDIDQNLPTIQSLKNNGTLIYMTLMLNPLKAK